MADVDHTVVGLKKKAQAEAHAARPFYEKLWERLDKTCKKQKSKPQEAPEVNFDEDAVFAEPAPIEPLPKGMTLEMVRHQNTAAFYEAEESGAANLDQLKLDATKTAQTAASQAYGAAETLEKVVRKATDAERKSKKAYQQFLTAMNGPFTRMQDLLTFLRQVKTAEHTASSAKEELTACRIFLGQETKQVFSYFLTRKDGQTDVHQQTLNQLYEQLGLLEASLSLVVSLFACEA